MTQSACVIRIPLIWLEPGENERKLFPEFCSSWVSAVMITSGFLWFILVNRRWIKKNDVAF